MAESTRPGFWKVAAVAGAFTLAVAGVWFGLGRENAPVGGSVHGSLSLTANQNNGEIQLHWDPHSEDLRRSKQGLLSIVDGDLQTSAPLRSEDLLGGRLSYAGVSNAMHFRLKVLGLDGQWREGEQLTVRLRPDQNAVAKVPVEKQAIEPAKRSSPSPKQAETPRRSVAEILEDRSTADRHEPSTNPPAEKPQQAAWIPPVTSAVLVRQVKPVLPANLERMIDQEVRLHVRLAIDESGNVIDAQQLGAKGFLADSLFRFAAEAARQWQYKPARLGTQAVATILDVEFRFAPSQ